MTLLSDVFDALVALDDRKIALTDALVADPENEGAAVELKQILEAEKRGGLSHSPELLAELGAVV